MNRYENVTLWFNRAEVYYTRGQRAKALHALKMGRQCARAAQDAELEAAFNTALTLMAA